MILGVFQQHAVTAIYPGETREAGQVYRDWKNGYEVDLPGVNIQAGDTREEHDRADARIADFTLYTGTDIHVDAWDRIAFVYNGRRRVCELVGDPVLLTDPFGALDHQVVALAERKDGR